MEIFIVFGVLAFLLIPFKVETQIMLEVPQEEVMRVLTTFEKYKEWNPFIVRISGKFRLHSMLNVTLNMENNKMHISPKIIAIQDDMFCWRGILGVRYIFDGIHCFKAEAMPRERTLLTHTEHFQGILVWFMFPMLLKTKKRFELMNEALREEVEVDKE